uniref:G-protein coupled receptors family 1 profile domain-containing protein n=1 Tax=Oncorhynchus tshawytscha TaxID=74940 RepID=A0A8C8CJC7_ONCTS
LGESLHSEEVCGSPCELQDGHIIDRTTETQHLLAIFLLVVYLMILIGKLIILTLVATDPKLQSAMYMFLSHLSLVDIVISTSVLPKMIAVSLWNDVTISYSACFLQLYVYLSFQTVESMLLCVMAYDRYVAICNPLRYSTAWASGLSLPVFCVVFAAQLRICSIKIHFWFCDLPPVVSLSSIYFPFTVIIWSYFRILVAVCKIASSEGRMKAFSTCSAHLTVVLPFYFAHSCVYISATSENIHCKVIILICIVNCFLTPVINPIIYSLRNKEITAALRRLCSGKGDSDGVQQGHV